jgi:hypothetical protein
VALQPAQELADSRPPQADGGHCLQAANFPACFLSGMTMGSIMCGRLRAICRSRTISTPFETSTKDLFEMPKGCANIMRIMIHLSPQAVRFVDQAIGLQGNPRQREDWLKWAQHSDNAPLPSHVAQIAIQALSGMALFIEDRLESGDLTSTEAASFENDLGYIMDIESDLANSLHEPERAYG